MLVTQESLMTWYAFLTNSHHSLDPGKWEPKLTSSRDKIFASYSSDLAAPSIYVICFYIISMYKCEPPKSVLWRCTPHLLHSALRVSWVVPLRNGHNNNATIAAPSSNAEASSVCLWTCMAEPGFDVTSPFPYIQPAPQQTSRNK